VDQSSLATRRLQS